MLRHTLLLAPVAALTLAGPAAAHPLPTTPPIQVSGASPFPPACNGAPQSGSEYRNAEVEPFVAVNPTDGSNLIASWQQDRWSSGGASGLGVAASRDGGASWTLSLPPFSRCAGGNPSNNGDYERATDPWVTFSPDGAAYQMSLAFSDATGASAMQVARSTDGGATWGPVTILHEDVDPNVFNDKNTMTADPRDARHVYAVWDRLEFPQEHASRRAGERALGYRGPTWFTRTTDGGATWEPARMIFDPGEQNQTLGNQIAVLPGGDLVNVFNLIHNAKNAGKTRGFNVAVQRSTDRGRTWSSPVIVSRLGTVGVHDPSTGEAVRTGDLIPDVAVDPRTGAVYVVWQDARFSSGERDAIVLSKSLDGGRTWSEPVRVSSTPATQAFTAAVEVASDGTVAVTYYDFRRDTADPAKLQTDYWIAHSHDGGATWTEDHVDGPFDMRTAPFASGYFVGDYEGLAAHGTAFHLAWNAANDGDIANRTDTFYARAG